jgi:signal transduction histidine kinase
MLYKEPTICIIEDSPQDREIFRRYLLEDVEYSYRFYEEETGEMGLETCRRINPDCILLDYNLPDMNGLEFLAELADESGTVSLPVVMVTGMGDESVALRAMKKGAQDYLVKDEMTPGNLFRAIHSAIQRSAMMRTLEQQRRDLEMKNQEIQAFAYALAHDMRAPLRIISNFAQIVEQDYSSVLDTEGRHFIDNIIHASSQMDRLINDLLNYTRIEHRNVRYKPIALAHVLQKLEADLALRITEMGASIVIADNLPVVSGDGTLINQIFINLLDNALTYRQPGVPTQITVGCRKESGYVVISVADNGIGIAQRHHEKIFNIFQRLHTEEEYPGTGIGLAIVRKSVDLLGGRIWLESQVSVGTTFYVRLPLEE